MAKKRKNNSLQKKKNKFQLSLRELDQNLLKKVKDITTVNTCKPWYYLLTAVRLAIINETINKLNNKNNN